MLWTQYQQYWKADWFLAIFSSLWQHQLSRSLRLESPFRGRQLLFVPTLLCRSCLGQQSPVPFLCPDKWFHITGDPWVYPALPWQVPVTRHRPLGRKPYKSNWLICRPAYLWQFICNASNPCVFKWFACILLSLLGNCVEDLKNICQTDKCDKA